MYVKILILLLTLGSFSVYAWSPKIGYPEKGFYIRGYSISGNKTAPIAELTVFPRLYKTGIFFVSIDGTTFSIDSAKVIITECGNIEEGITKGPEILHSTEWNFNLLTCKTPIYVSVQDKLNSTIYRFPNDN